MASKSTGSIIRLATAAPTEIELGLSVTPAVSKAIHAYVQDCLKGNVIYKKEALLQRFRGRFGEIDFDNYVLDGRLILEGVDPSVTTPASDVSSMEPESKTGPKSGTLKVPGSSPSDTGSLTSSAFSDAIHAVQEHGKVLRSRISKPAKVELDQLCHQTDRILTLARKRKARNQELIAEFTEWKEKRDREVAEHNKQIEKFQTKLLNPETPSLVVRHEDLKQQLEEITERVSILEQEKEDLTTQKLEVDTENHQLHQQITTVQQTNEDYKQEINGLTQSNQQQQLQITELTDKLEKQKTDFTIQIEELQQKKEEQEAQLVNLRTLDTQGWHTQLAEKTRDLAESEKKVTELQELITKQEKECKQLNSNNESMTKIIKVKETTIGELQHQLDKLRQLILDKDKEIMTYTHCQQENEQVKQQLALAQEEVSKLNLTLTEYRIWQPTDGATALLDKQKDLDELNEKYNDLSETLDQSRKVNDKLQTDLSDIKTKLSQVNLKVQTLQGENQSVKEQNEKLKIEKEQLAQLNEKYQNDILKKSLPDSINSRLISELTQTKDRYREADKQRKEIGDALVLKTQEVEAKQKSLTNLNVTCQQVLLQNQQLKQEIEELHETYKGEIAVLNEEMFKLQNGASPADTLKLKNKLEQTEQELASSTSSLALLKSKQVTLENQTAELEQNNKQLSSQVSTLTQQKATAEAEVVNLTASIKDKEGYIKKLQSNHNGNGSVRKLQEQLKSVQEQLKQSKNEFALERQQVNVAISKRDVAENKTKEVEVKLAELEKQKKELEVQFTNLNQKKAEMQNSYDSKVATLKDANEALFKEKKTHEATISNLNTSLLELRQGTPSKPTESASASTPKIAKRDSKSSVPLSPIKGSLASEEPSDMEVWLCPSCENKNNCMDMKCIGCGQDQVGPHVKTPFSNTSFRLDHTANKTSKSESGSKSQTPKTLTKEEDDEPSSSDEEKKKKKKKKKKGTSKSHDRDGSKDRKKDKKKNKKDRDDDSDSSNNDSEDDDRKKKKKKDKKKKKKKDDSESDEDKKAKKKDKKKKKKKDDSDDTNDDDDDNSDEDRKSKKKKKDKQKKKKKDTSSGTEDSSSDSEEESSDDDQKYRRYDRSMEPKMELFDASGKLKWSTFFLRFDRTAKNRRWKDEVLIEKLLHCLSGPPLEYVEKLGITDDYDAMVKELQAAYDPVVDDLAKRYEADSVLQGDLTLEAFHAQVHALVMEGWATLDKDFQITTCIEKFLKGVNDRDAFVSAANRTPKTCRQAVEYMRQAVTVNALKYVNRRKVRTVELEDEGTYCVNTVEASKLNGGQSVSPNSNYGAQASGANRFTPPSSPRIQRRSQSPRRSRSPNRGCWNCQVEGHFYNQCPEPLNPQLRDYLVRRGLPVPDQGNA